MCAEDNRMKYRNVQLYMQLALASVASAAPDQLALFDWLMGGAVLAELA